MGKTNFLGVDGGFHLAKTISVLGETLSEICGMCRKCGGLKTAMEAHLTKLGASWANVIIAIEWPSRIAEAMPEHAITVSIEHLKEHERSLTIDQSSSGDNA